jgi:hypothetical protein
MFLGQTVGAVAGKYFVFRSNAGDLEQGGSIDDGFGQDQFGGLLFRITRIKPLPVPEVKVACLSVLCRAAEVQAGYLVLTVPERENDPALPKGAV